MKKITLLFISCVAICSSLTAQNNTFLKAYSSGGSIFWQYAEPVTNGYIYAGTIGSNLVWAQVDTSGNITVCKKYTSSLGFSSPSTNSNSIVCTALPGNATLVTCPYKNGLRLLKINNSGSLAWSTYFKLSAYSDVILSNITLDNNAKNFWVYGYGHIGKIITAFIINADSTGAVTLSKNIVIDTNSNGNGTGGLRRFGSFAQSSDNNCYIGLNWTKPTVSGPPQPSGCVFVKTDSLLNKKWVKNGPVGNVSNIIIRGNRLVALNSYTTYNPSPGPGLTYYYGCNVFDTACTTYSYLQIWDGGPPGTLKLLPLAGNTCMIYGNYANSFYEGLAMKINDSNKVQWAKRYSLLKNSNYEGLSSLTPTPDNGFIMTGLITDNTFGTALSAYVIKSDSNGSGTCYDNVFSPSVSNSGNKTSIDSVTFSPLTVTDSVIAITSVAIADTMVTYCYDNILTGISNVGEEKPEVKVFPNPNNGVFTIKSSGISRQSLVEVYNMIGEKVYSKQLSTVNSQLSIDISNHSPGIYLYRVLSETGNVIATGKVAVK